MKKRKIRSWILAASLTLVSTGAWAQKDKPKVPVAQKDKTAPVTDLKELNAKVTDLAKSAKVGLLLQFQYINSGFNSFVGKGFSTPIKASTTTGNNFNDLFTPKRAEVAVQGDLVPNKISYLLKADPFATTTAKSGVSNGEQVKDYSVKLSYVTYADLQVGQGKYPQGLEGRQPSGTLDFANRALVVTALNDRRDFFIQVSGTQVPIGPFSLDYAAALVQGAGQNTIDNNDAKDQAARVGVDFTGTGIWLGASGYNGWENTTTFGGARQFLGLEGRWTLEGFKLQGELLFGRLEPGNNYNPWAGTTSANALESNPWGWYLSANYRLGDVRFGLRGESYDPDTTAGSKHNVNIDVVTVGADWFQDNDKFKFSLDVEEHYGQYEAVIGQAQVNI